MSAAKHDLSHQAQLWFELSRQSLPKTALVHICPPCVMRYALEPLAFLQTHRHPTCEYFGTEMRLVLYALSPVYDE